MAEQRPFLNGRFATLSACRRIRKRTEAGNRGFRLLAGYIFGQNRGERKIAMTAPVTQAPAKITMTAPVTQTPADGRYVVQFTMPSEYTLETLPEPLDPQEKLREVAGGRRGE